MSIKVSIVILTYNNLHLLEKALTSVSKQKYNNFELIIQDDCSRNFDLDKINHLLSKYDNLKNKTIVHSNNPNLGTVRSFNYAISMTSGELIIPLACDDQFYDSNVISNIVLSYLENGWDIATGYRFGLRSKNKLPSKETVNNFINLSPYEKFLRVCYSSFFSGAALYYSKNFLIEAELFNENFKLLEDYPIILFSILKHKKLFFLDYITIKYSEDGVSAKRKKINPILKEDFKQVYNLIIFPNIEKNEFSFFRRFMHYRYDKNFCSDTLLAKLVNYIKYIDIVFFKLNNKIFKLSEFDELIKKGRK